jgi:hypothetical protein
MEAVKIFSLGSKVCGDKFLGEAKDNGENDGMHRGFHLKTSRFGQTQKNSGSKDVEKQSRQ